MSIHFTKPHLKVFHELLRVVGFSSLDTYDDEDCIKKLFQNIDETYKEELFGWFLKEFNFGLESYASSQEKLRRLLFRTGMIHTELECANFLSGLLPNEEQLKIWKNILAVVYYHCKKHKSEAPSEQENKEEPASSKTKTVNLLPPEYQKEFEEQTKGNYKEYTKRMKEKLLKRDEDKENVSLSNDSEDKSGMCLEATVSKVLNSKPSSQQPVCSHVKQLDLNSIAEFRSLYDQLVKPHTGPVLEQATKQDVLTLEHFGEFLEEYSFMAQVLGSFRQLAEYRDQSTSCDDSRLVTTRQ